MAKMKTRNKRCGGGELARLAEVARAAGWRIELAPRSSHYAWIPPDKSLTPVIHSGSPGDFRALKNHISRLRRRGLDV